MPRTLHFLVALPFTLSLMACAPGPGTLAGLALVGALAAGGGGGSSAPLPSINMTSGQSGEIDVGSEYSFSWTTTNAQSCSASGDWSTDVGISGSHTQKLPESKTYQFTLTCQNSDGASSSSSLSVISNYLLIGGKIIDKDKANRTVYIDQNQNRNFDAFEYSGVSDGQGNYQIRAAEDIDCLKDFPIAVSDSILYSNNPLPNKEQVNVSLLTSFFRGVAPWGLSTPAGDFFNSAEPCNSWDTQRKNRTRAVVIREIQLQQNVTGYSYQDLQTLDSSRLSDADSFYSSLTDIEDLMVEEFIDELDSELAAVGGSADDFEVASASDLMPANLTIFLNDESYPASLADSYAPEAIEQVSVRSNFALVIDPKPAVSIVNQTGWDEHYYIQFFPAFVNNNGQLLSDEKSCHVILSSDALCDVSGETFNGSTPVYDTDFDYWLEKDTSRGKEEIRSFERNYKGVASCRRWDANSITYLSEFESVDDSFAIDFYWNFNEGELDAEGLCVPFSPLADDKYMESRKFYADGSSAFFYWDNTEIESLPDAFSVFELSESNPPPSRITSDIVDQFSGRPYISAFEADDDTLSLNAAQNIAAEMIAYADQRRALGDYSWMVFGVRNTQEGRAVARYFSDPYNYGYIICEVEGVWNIFPGYGSDLSNSLYDCLTTQDDNGDFIFSRSSQHQAIDLSQYTRSPYSGLVPLDQLGARSAAAQRISLEQRASEREFDPNIFQRNPVLPLGARQSGAFNR